MVAWRSQSGSIVASGCPGINTASLAGMPPALATKVFGPTPHRPRPHAGLCPVVGRDRGHGARRHRDWRLGHPGRLLVSRVAGVLCGDGRRDQRRQVRSRSGFRRAGLPRLPPVAGPGRGPAADRHDARVAGDAARAAGRRDGRARGQGHHAARHRPWVGAPEGACRAGRPRPQYADAGRRGVRRRRP